MLPAPDPYATRSADPAHAPSAVRAAGRGRATALAALVRTHWLITVLLAAGLVLRLLTVFAYRPALLYVDTFKYLLGEYPGSDPLGYRLILKVILVAGNLQLVAIIQHLLGLAIAVTLYVLLLRRGAPRWLAALAAGPVLLDAYQLQIEHMIMPDVWFEALVVAGLAVLLWRPAVTVPAAAAAGLVLGSSATVKQAGELLILPVAVFLLLAVRGWGRALATSGVTIAAFVLPILGYCTVSLIQTGHFWLSAGQPNSGRMAYAADCATLKLPPAVRPLCPSPAAQANGPDWLEHSGQSPLRTAPIPPGANRKALIDQLTSAVLHQQPLQGGRLRAPRLGPAVRADQGRRAERHADRALAVPAGVPAVPAVGLHRPGQRDHRRRPARHVRPVRQERAEPGLRRPGPGQPRPGDVPAPLPDPRRLHAGPAVPAAHADRAGRLGGGPGPAAHRPPAAHGAGLLPAHRVRGHPAADPRLPSSSPGGISCPR